MKVHFKQSLMYPLQGTAVIVILPNISSLVQYQKLIAENSERLWPKNCPECNQDHFIRKGCYCRKPNYTKAPDEKRIDPVPILRYYCKNCNITFSALPECLPPRRHYIWDEQQAVVEPVLQGESYYKVDKNRKPSRWTISRWFRRLIEQERLHLDCFRALMPELGRLSYFATSWLQLFAQRSLAQLMRILHQAGIPVP